MEQMEEGHVLTCLAQDCAYNTDCECDAPRIQVGGDHARCDTYTTGQVAKAEAEPLVSMCDIIDCHFNQSRLCDAAGVTMAAHSGHADCVTYRI
jgi:hypothetical protein